LGKNGETPTAALLKTKGGEDMFNRRGGNVRVLGWKGSGEANRKERIIPGPQKRKSTPRFEKKRGKTSRIEGGRKT